MARPTFSPNGRIIAFESQAKGKSSVQIQTIPVWGKTPTPLTTGDSINRDPSWSPDGTHIVFSSNREKSNIFSIYTIKTDGTCLKRITTHPEVKSKTDIVADLFPVFSPDGKKLLFSSNRSGTYQLYLIDYEEPKECLEGKG